MRFCENCGTPVPEQSEPPQRANDRANAPQRANDRANTPQRTNDRANAPQRASDRANTPRQTGDSANTPQRANDRANTPQRRGNSYQDDRHDAPQRQSGRYQNDRQDAPQRQSSAYQNDRQDAPQRRSNSYQDDRQGQYRQERMERDWEQSWERSRPDEEDGGGMTPIQYVLIGLTVVLLIALIVFGVFWVMGRSSDKTAEDRGGGSSQELQTNKLEDESDGQISILDDGNNSQSETQKQSETQPETKQSETQPQSEADIVLNYPEFSVMLPGSWKGKYGITQGADYYTFYHQASRAKNAGGAFFTISKYKDTSYKELPQYEVLGTGNNAAFVFWKPTDAQAATDAAAAQEYQTMAADVDTIKAGIKVLVSGAGPAETEPVQIETQPQTQAQTQASSGGYIAESSQRALTENDVAGMDYDDLQMAINEIYSRHGRKFADPGIQEYFNGQSWYQGIIDPEDFSDSVFSATESQNIQFLLKKMGIQ